MPTAACFPDLIPLLDAWFGKPGQFGFHKGNLCIWRDSVTPEVLEAALHGMVCDPMVGGGK